MALIAVSVLVFIFTFAPMLKEEIRYQLTRADTVAPVLTQAERRVMGTGESKPSSIVPVDENFGIVIPKIGANARIIPDVDWQDSRVYQRALTRGVAQAAGTAKPGEPGNMFLFAHSGTDFYEAARYNAEFYLLNKLIPGDVVHILYAGQRYEYTVTESKKVGAEAVEYLKQGLAGETLTLMTCWPPGTTLKRLVVTAERDPQL